MAKDDAEVLSAEVILRQRGSGPADQPITSANVRDIMPPPETADRVARSLTDRGFAVGPAGPLSMSITGGVDLFAKTFGGSKTSLRRLMRRGGSAEGHSFDVERLGPDLAEVVEAVVIPRRPDFGPGSP